MTTLPHAESAIIAAEKLRDYLLNVDHRRGGSKARLFHAFGYRRDAWTQLDHDLRESHLRQPVIHAETGEYGVRYEIVGELQTPVGRPLRVRSVWQIDHGTTAPRLITIVPEQPQ